MFFQALSNENDGNAVVSNSFFLQHIIMISEVVLDYMQFSLSWSTEKNSNNMIMAQKVVSWKGIAAFVFTRKTYWFIRCEISHFSWNSWG